MSNKGRLFIETVGSHHGEEERTNWPPRRRHGVCVVVRTDSEVEPHQGLRFAMLSDPWKKEKRKRRDVNRTGGSLEPVKRRNLGETAIGKFAGEMEKAKQEISSSI